MRRARPPAASGARSSLPNSSARPPSASGSSCHHPSLSDPPGCVRGLSNVRVARRARPCSVRPSRASCRTAAQSVITPIARTAVSARRVHTLLRGAELTGGREVDGVAAPEAAVTVPGTAVALGVHHHDVHPPGLPVGDLEPGDAERSAPQRQPDQAGDRGSRTSRDGAELRRKLRRTVAVLPTVAGPQLGLNVAIGLERGQASDRVDAHGLLPRPSCSGQRPRTPA
jgi:hypothetical protein